MVIDNDTYSDILTRTGKKELDKFIKEYARDKSPNLQTTPLHDARIRPGKIGDEQ